MNIHCSISAGLVDAGLSSLATLGVGLYAARTLSPGELGAYAVYFSAFAVATVVPAQLLLVPAAFETASRSERAGDRLRLVGQTWRLGLPFGFAAALIVTAVATSLSNHPAGLERPLALTTVVAATASPLQDQVRRILHLSGRSWRAAATSAVQLATVSAALLAGTASGTDVAWRPFGALAIANVVSLATSCGLARARRPEGHLGRLPIWSLFRSGRWLVLQQLATSGSLFVSSVLVARLSGPAELGYSEAARIVAQPVFVLTTALHSVLWPASARAGAQADREGAAQVFRLFAVILGTAGTLYGTLTLGAVAINPLPELLPGAYATGALVPLSVLALIVVGAASPVGSELVGAGRERSLAAAAGVAGGVQCAVATSAGWLGAATRPAGMIAAGLAGLAVLHRFRISLYRSSAGRPGQPASVPTPVAGEPVL